MHHKREEIKTKFLGRLPLPITIDSYRTQKTPWITATIPLTHLIVLVIIALLAVATVEGTKIRTRSRSYPAQVKAARLMEESMCAIKDYRFSLSIPIDRELDLNETGIIGTDFTELTTSLGVLEAKRTAANPDLAALMVKWFEGIGLKKGDVVAVGASGSFPGLILATLSAASALELRPLVIYSIGSSMYGANIPGFTFIEMLDHLNDLGIIPYKLTGVSLGGNNDRAEGIALESQYQAIAEIAEANGIPFIYEESLEASINKRLTLYQQASRGKPVKCFVNIGGASPNYGNTPVSLRFPNGLVNAAHFSIDSPERGLIFEYSLAGVPVINLLNIREIAIKNGIPIDPVPLPEIGEGDVYFDWRYRKPVAVAALAVVAAVLCWSLRYRRHSMAQHGRISGE